MILPLPACMCLCLCLAYAFANCESEFDFSDLSVWKSYVPITGHLAPFCSWLPSCLQCTMYMYGCGYDFSTFHFRICFREFVWSLCVGPQTLPKSSFMRGDSLLVMEKNVVIKEALAFERPAFCDFPQKTCFHAISYLDFLASRSCFVSGKHGLQCEPNGFSIEPLCGSDVLPRCN